MFADEGGIGVLMIEFTFLTVLDNGWTLYYFRSGCVDFISMCEGCVNSISTCEGCVNGISLCEGCVNGISLCEGCVKAISFCEPSIHE